MVAMRRRRGRGKAGVGGGNASMTATPPLSFSLPLRDTSKPVAFPGDFQNHIALEFAMRYLCEIGATPTIENCRWVLREMPLKNCSVTAAWKSRGCLADAIIIQPGAHRNGRVVSGVTGGSMGEAPPTPADSPPNNTPSGKDNVSGVPESTDHASTKGGASARHGSSKSAKRNRPTRESAQIRQKPVLCQPASSMGKASPHKVSIFVDAVTSAIGPAIIETTKGSQPTDVSGAVGALAAAAATIQTAGTTTARDRNNRRRRNGEMPVRDICTNTMDPNQRQWKRQQQDMHGGQPPGGGRKFGILKESTTIFSGTEAGGDVIGGGDGDIADESLVRNGIAFAEARQKMLDPPKVDMAAIAAIQAAFARNFPFQHHGEKFADLTARSSLKNLITSHGPGRLIGLLSHYLFWIILLPFALAHKSRDDSFLLETDNRLLTKNQQKDQARFRVADGGRLSPTARVTPAGAVSPSATTISDGGAHHNQDDTSTCATNHNNKPDQETGREAGGQQHQHHPTPSEGEKRRATWSWFPGPPEETDPVSQPRLTPDEAESLFVAVVEAWSSLRSSLGASRRGRLVQLPIAVAAVRHGVQTVLCNCYPFLDTKGGREGKRLLASLHEEVAARFIPRFYYEGPFTPAAEEEKEEAQHRIESAGGAATVTAAAARRGTPSRAEVKRLEDRATQGPAQGEQHTRHLRDPPPSSGPRPSTSSPEKKKANFLETSSTLLAARRWTRAGSSGVIPGSAALDGGRPSTTTTAEVGPADEVPHVVGGSAAARFARERPGGTQRTGEALFATSTTLEYVFPKPCSPEARKMLASRARARSSRDASRTTTSPDVGAGRSCFGFTNSSPRSACRRVVTDNSALQPPSRAASTSGARTQPVRAAMGEGRNAVAIPYPVQVATSGVVDNKSPRRPRTTAGAGIGAAAALLQRRPPQHRDEHPMRAFAGSRTPGEVSRFSPGGAIAPGIDGRKTRFPDQTSGAGNETLRPLATPAARESGTSRGRGSDLGVDVDIRVRVGGIGVGAAAKARLYRGYCAQRGGDYDREYRRHGGKEVLERIALLNDTFR